MNVIMNIFSVEKIVHKKLAIRIFNVLRQEWNILISKCVVLDFIFSNKWLINDKQMILQMIYVVSFRFVLAVRYLQGKIQAIVDQAFWIIYARCIFPMQKYGKLYSDPRQIKRI